MIAPWIIDGSYIRSSYVEEGGFRGRLVASVIESTAAGGGVQADLDSRLIAAAPELLEQLRMLSESYDRLLALHDEAFEWGTVASDAARAVIAKATGSEVKL